MTSWERIDWLQMLEITNWNNPILTRFFDFDTHSPADMSQLKKCYFQG